MPTGETFDSDGVRIAYDDLPPEGGADPTDAPPVLLVHGFASSRANNWRDQEWYDHLREAGRRVIALDNRGHGESGKPHDSGAYDLATMGGDALALVDHLGIEEADLVGYSMGGRIGTELVTTHGDRFNAAVLGGVGDNVVVDSGASEGIARALLADDPDAIENPVGKRFRLFAEANGNDLEALAACIRAHSATPDAETLGRVDLPVLVVAGSDDDIVGDPDTLAEKFGNGEAVVVDGEDHITAVGTDRFKDAVADFLDREGL